MAGANGRPTMEAVVGVLGDAGLDPLPDEVAHAVAAKCPVCRARASDGYYPLTITITMRGELRIVCLQGCDEDAIATAIPGLLDGNGTAQNAIHAALEEARVDLIDLIRKGIPPRKFVPGCHGRLAAGKRHHVAAEHKSGKSIALGVVDAIDIIEAGGTVAVLDRENGADEYARRLQDALKARNASPELYEAVQQRFRYYAWPRFKLEWATNDNYPTALAGADLVIFDSSRKFLTAVGLDENASDDFSKFTEALIDPLMRAGIATMILDNTGHDEKGRPRGTSSKGDLTDVMFTLKKLVDFDRDQTGRVELTRRESRLGEIQGRWTMEIGGGVYDAWQRPDENGKEIFRQAAIAVLIAGEPPIGRDVLIKDSREKGAKGRNEVLRAWLIELGADATSGIVKTSEGYVPEGWPETPGHSGATPHRSPPGPPPPPYGGQGSGDPGPAREPGMPEDMAQRMANWTPPAPSSKSKEEDAPDERRDLA